VSSGAGWKDRGSGLRLRRAHHRAETTSHHLEDWKDLRLVEKINRPQATMTGRHQEGSTGRHPGGLTSHPRAGWRGLRPAVLRRRRPEA
jgi:hypothetical protein